MPDDDVQLRDQIARKTDDELLSMVNREYGDYRSDTLDLARGELLRRGYDESQMEPGKPSTSSFERMADAVDDPRLNLTTTDFTIPHVRLRLKQEGLQGPAAEEMAKWLVSNRAVRRRRVGVRNMVMGALVLLTGFVFTLVSYLPARRTAGVTGGSWYAIFPGLIAVGVGLVLLGAGQYRRR
jgi:hypothetical protein